MKLYSGEGMVQGSGLWCRQSRLRGTLGGLFLAACFVGGAVLARKSGAPLWFWILFSVGAALGVFISLRSIVARFRSTNWVLRVQSEGLWINLRPLQRFDVDGPASSLKVQYREIARVNEHVDTWSTPSREGGSIFWKLKSLDLHLTSGDATELLPAMAEARVAGHGHPVSVLVPAPDLIRIAWRGHGHDVVPSLSKVLAELRGNLSVSAPTRTERPDWRKLSDSELDEQVELLIQCGEEMEASSLLMRRRDCSATEAHQLVKELSRRR